MADVGRVFFDSHNVQKSVTQIVYLGPLGSGQRYQILWHVFAH